MLLSPAEILLDEGKSTFNQRLQENQYPFPKIQILDLFLYLVQNKSRKNFSDTQKKNSCQIEVLTDKSFRDENFINSNTIFTYFLSSQITYDFLRVPTIKILMLFV